MKSEDHDKAAQSSSNEGSPMEVVATEEQSDKPNEPANIPGDDNAMESNGNDSIIPSSENPNNPTTPEEPKDATQTPSEDRKRSPSVAGLEDIDNKPNKSAKPTKRATPRKKKTPPPPRVSTRPSRTRKAPERLQDAVAPAQPKKPATTKGKASNTRLSYDPVYLTTNVRSRLATHDLFHMLLEPQAWDSLTPADKTELINLLPPTQANKDLLSLIEAGETDIPRPKEFTISYDPFRSDIARFQNDLRNGRRTKKWQADADQAMIDRANGTFDEWKEREKELWWGQNLDPDTYKETKASKD
ncbi:hypothetical protein BU24DRAFT_422876 [Aaosphaeria arxii CBS 175.79]|uniref:ASX DEUBAD domain-containing protein n=1 Tax=Aaosphaeria arxii CBS 175.79 TaxID=1450172 RepID=A0A6A5XTB4_9PLEO|nr:uncharacterized protein BU24DRAFT_422876 [Aaosphaeria arxii CBS 175.79]KAF2016528.1 hypothetical protein BU24DRAFT_422876 [Aaosphaeria arxii CBS 175.79]